MAAGGDFCTFPCTNRNSFGLLFLRLSKKFRYASIINLVNIGVCLIGAAAFAKASAVILGIVIICLSVVIVSFLAQPAFEVIRLF